MKCNEKLQKSDRYDRFTVIEGNRPLETTDYRYKKLRDSMKKYGFLPPCPVHCRQRGGKYEIFDGQNRFAVAKELGIPFYFVVYNNGKIDLSEINDVQRPWNLRNHVGRYAQEGIAHYRELLDFSDKYRISLGIAAGLLSGGNAAAGEKSKQIKRGEYKVTDRNVAELVATTALELSSLTQMSRHANFLNALVRCIRVKEFLPSRFVEKARKCPAKLVPQADVQSYLRMIEEVYNFHSKNPIPVAFMANEVERKRSLRVRNAV